MATAKTLREWRGGACQGGCAGGSGCWSLRFIQPQCPESGNLPLTHDGLMGTTVTRITSCLEGDERLRDLRQRQAVPSPGNQGWSLHTPAVGAAAIVPLPLPGDVGQLGSSRDKACLWNAMRDAHFSGSQVFCPRQREF